MPQPTRRDKYPGIRKKKKAKKTTPRGKVIEKDGDFLTLTDIYSKENLLCQKDSQKKRLLGNQKKSTGTNMTIQK